MLLLSAKKCYQYAIIVFRTFITQLSKQYTISLSLQIISKYQSKTNKKQTNKQKKNNKIITMNEKLNEVTTYQ